MKYYVQVNRHMMVTVEATSALSAEHYFLDMDGIQYSNAFSDEDRSTDTFRGALLDCETVSKSEVKKLSEDYAAAWRDVAAAHVRISTAERELERIKEMLNSAMEELKSARDDYNVYLTAARAAKAKIGLEDND